MNAQFLRALFIVVIAIVSSASLQADEQLAPPSGQRQLDFRVAAKLPDPPPRMRMTHHALMTDTRTWISTGRHRARNPTGGGFESAFMSGLRLIPSPPAGDCVRTGPVSVGHWQAVVAHVRHAAVSSPAGPCK